MARVEGTCKCPQECECKGKATSTWVDAVTGYCRSCEIDHGERWGHHGTPAEKSNL